MKTLNKTVAKIKNYLKCPICNNLKKKKLIWNDKIRSGNTNGRKTKTGWKSKALFTEKKEKIYKCSNCDVCFLANIKTYFEGNNDLLRKQFDGSNSIRKYLDFDKPREIKKINKILKFVNFKNKKVIESYCGAGSILDKIKSKCLKTAGLDDEIYKNYLEKRGHLFFSNLSQIINSKKKFDIVLSLGEIEHKINPNQFLQKLKKILLRKGLIVMRIPNHNNIYRFLLGKNFTKYDYRVSHNFYFSEKSLDFLFRKNNLSIIKKIGLNEYSINHLIDYIKKQRRVSENNREFFNKKLNLNIIQNIEKNMISTSLLYILRKKN
tara:strand:- start:486 stop:1448 length:963 start_codon:yes stop_codon:yes gene_type:complete